MIRNVGRAAAAAAGLAPALASAGGGGEALGYALMVFAGVNLLLYVGVALCLGLGAWNWQRRRRFALVCLALATLPIAHYGLQWTRTLFEPARRSAQLAALPLQRVPPGPLRTLETVRGFTSMPRELDALVATGLVQEAFASIGATTLRVVRKEGWDCLASDTDSSPQAEYRRVLRARQAFRVCAETVSRNEPAPPASMQLLVGPAAPHHYEGPACPASYLEAIELRLPPAQGGALVAYREPGLLRGYAFPPILAFLPRLWWCPDRRMDAAELARVNAVPLVAEALGFRAPDDFPRAADPKVFPEALQRLIPQLQGQFAHEHILALLGQWPATPASDALVGAGPIAEAARSYLLREAARLLADPAQRERQRRLYPQLPSHLPALLQACALHEGRYDTQQPCAQLARAAAAPRT